MSFFIHRWTTSSSWNTLAKRFHSTVPSITKRDPIIAKNKNAKVETAEILIESPKVDVATALSHSPKRFEQLPFWARSYTIPQKYKTLGFWLSMPMLIGGIATHIIPETTQWAHYSRDALDWTLRYGCSILCLFYGINYGMQFSRFALPEVNKALLGIPRCIAAPFSVIIASFATRLAIDMGVDSPMTLICAFGLLCNLDYLYHRLCMQPAWFFNWRVKSYSLIGAGLVLCLLSESVLLLGIHKEIY